MRTRKYGPVYCPGVRINKQNELILQLKCKEGMLKRLKDNDDKDPEVGGDFDRQPGVGASASGHAKAEGESDMKLVVYQDTTNVQHVNSIKENVILFVDDRGFMMSMVNNDEIEED